MQCLCRAFLGIWYQSDCSERLCRHHVYTFSLTVSAQTTDQSIELREVEVKAARIIHKTDGLLLYPSDAQKEASSSGYSVLQNLVCPISASMKMPVVYLLSTIKEACNYASMALL